MDLRQSPASRLSVANIYHCRSTPQIREVSLHAVVPHRYGPNKLSPKISPAQFDEPSACSRTASKRRSSVGLPTLGAPARISPPTSSGRLWALATTNGTFFARSACATRVTGPSAKLMSSSATAGASPSSNRRSACSILATGPNTDHPRRSRIRAKSNAMRNSSSTIKTVFRTSHSGVTFFQIDPNGMVISALKPGAS